MSDTLFAFDLDGTVTACELLPYIAAACGIDAPMRELFGFSTALRSATQGRAGMVLRFARFDLA